MLYKDSASDHEVRHIVHGSNLHKLRQRIVSRLGVAANDNLHWVSESSWILASYRPWHEHHLRKVPLGVNAIKKLMHRYTVQCEVVVSCFSVTVALTVRGDARSFRKKISQALDDSGFPAFDI